MSDLHELDAAYVLGALSSEERRAFEAHLAECAWCTASVADLAGMPGLLSLVSTEDAVALLDEPAVPAASPAIVTKLAKAEVRSRRRDRVIAGGLLAAAAAAVLVGVLVPRQQVLQTATPSPWNRSCPA